MATFALTAISMAIIGLGILFLLRRISTPSAIAECDAAWVNDFSVAKYRPMLRLLAEQDYDFLKSQPGFNPKMLRRLRSQRREIFRGYLRSLVRDFHKLHLAARMALLYNHEDRPDLASALVRQKMLFTLAVTAVEVRLLAHAIGIGTVDVRGLMEALEAMRSSAGRFAPAQVGAF